MGRELYYIVYYVVRYRRKLVRHNILQAFPEKTEAERLKIEKDFYRYFCDSFLETLQLIYLSDEEMKKRFVFKNTEIIDELLAKGQSVILMMGHYGNWEWVMSMMLWFKRKEQYVFGQIYRPLKNPVSDRLFLKLRSRFHSVNFPKSEIYRKIIQMKRDKQTWLLGFVADQKPSANQLDYWTTFLNQDTPVLTGPERIAVQTHAAVCYVDVRQLKRGYYEGEVQLISDNPEAMPKFEISEQYMRRMETTILRNPALWLWSHNRWKYKKITKQRSALANYELRITK
ncbi:acetyltransferase [Bacteroidia bacterium]|nr:acetyltransferase [Bacteroidia bacterium]